MNIVFWLSWWATLGLCTWQIVKAFLSPERMLHWPFLACMMWLYFYVYMAYQVKAHLAAYAPDWALALGQCVPLVCLIAVLYGWRIGTRVRSIKRNCGPAVNYHPLTLWVIGMAAVVIGSLGNFSVARATNAEGGHLDYASTSAYWYLLFYVGYPGLAISLWAIYRMPIVLKLVCMKFFAVGAFIFMLPNVINARRGPLFPTVLIFLLVPPLAKRTNPRRLIFVGSLVGAAFLMLLFVRAREWVYKEGTWSEALSNVSVIDLVERGQDTMDNEYLNNCHVIGTLAQTGKYDYGTGDMGLLLHWIPHQLWANKPMLGEGYHPKFELFDDIESVMHVRLLGSGAAPGGVAQTFTQYGFFCPISWFLLSLMAGRVYRRARLSGDPRWLVCYVSLMCSTHWLVAQGLDAAFVPAMFFQGLPLLAFAIAPKVQATARASHSILPPRVHRVPRSA